MFGLSHGKKCHFNQMSQSKVISVSCPRPLKEMTIRLGQCGHFNPVGPFEKSRFFIV
jgi:hypothetical protein